MIPDIDLRNPARNARGFEFTSSNFSTLASRVRSWAPLILETCMDEEEKQTLGMEIVDTLSLLEQGQRSLEWSGNLQQFQSQTLIHAVCLGSVLGSNKYVANAVPLALKVSLPQLHMPNLLDCVKFPKATTIGRAGSAMDFAFLLLCRDMWQHRKRFHYAWADSSPQSGKEWFMMMHASVFQDSVLSACRAANRLTRSRSDLTDHFEAEDLELGESPRLHEDLLECVVHHRCIPVALGSGKGAVEDKVSCMLHALGLECPTLQFLQEHLNDFVSWTTDLGLEAMLPQFNATSLSAVLPPYFQPRLDSDIADDGEDGVPRSEFESIGAGPIMPGTLLTAGGLHISHNASQDLHQKMEWWGPFWSHLKAVADLLVPTHLRDRLVAQCVRGTPAASMEHVFASISLPPLYEKRWQVVVKFLNNLLAHFKLVKQVWNFQRFLIDGKDADGDLGSAFDQALSSPMFCSYLFMVHGLHKILSNLENWLESCACHEHLFQNMSSNRQRKKRRKLFGGGTFADCPMRGKRASELAAGKIEETLAELSSTALNFFSGEVDPGISEADRALLSQDFQYAKAHLHFVLLSKLDFWQKIPWRLCGLSHHWPSIARKVASECVKEFEESMAKPGMRLEHHHPVSVRFLARDGPLRSDLEAFIGGSSMSVPLELAASSLKFVPVVERVVEGLHRNVKIASKHVRIGPTKVSLAVRLQEVMEGLETRPAFLRDLEAKFDVTRQPKQAAAALGILSHPIFAPLLQNGCTDPSVWLSALVKVVHRCDLETQFGDRSTARTEHKKKRKTQTEEFQALHDARSLPTPRTYDAIFKRAIIDHLHSMAGSNFFFSLPVLDFYQVHPLLSHADKRRREEVNEAAGSDIVETRNADTVPGEAQLFFRVLHSGPSRMKSMPMPAAMAPAFAKDAFVIAVHHATYVVDGVPGINMSAATVPQVLECLEACPLDVLRYELQSWTLSSSIQYSLPNVLDCDQADLVRGVTSLINARALPGGEPFRSRNLPGTILNAMFRDGLIDRFNFRDGGRVALSELALPQIHVVGALENQKVVCSLPQGELSDYDLMELILALENKGWVWKTLPKTKTARQKLCHVEGGALEWYSQSHVINKSYLQCLLESERLFQEGIVSIPHWTPKPSLTYPAILSGKGIQLIEEVPALESDLPVERPSAALMAPPVVEEESDREMAVERQVDDILNMVEELEAHAMDDQGDVPSSRNSDIIVDVVEAISDPAPLAAEAAEAPDSDGAEADQAPSSDSDIPRLGKPAAWGPFKLTVKQPSSAAGRAFGGIEASCPFHRKNEKTGCKKYLQLRSDQPDEFSKCLRSLKMWCNSAASYERQRDHLAHHISIDAAPPDAILEAGLIEDGPSERPTPDNVLDAAAGIEPAAKPKAKGKARAKAAGKPKAAKGRGRGRGRGRWGFFSRMAVKIGFFFVSAVTNCFSVSFFLAAVPGVT